MFASRFYSKENDFIVATTFLFLKNTKIFSIDQKIINEDKIHLPHEDYDQCFVTVNELPFSHILWMISTVTSSKAGGENNADQTDFLTSDFEHFCFFSLFCMPSFPQISRASERERKNDIDHPISIVIQTHSNSQDSGSYRGGAEAHVKDTKNSSLFPLTVPGENMTRVSISVDSI